jgi:isoleucyl-tRNA synthetase
VLAEAELEYGDVEGPSIFVNFPLLRPQPEGAPDLSSLLGIGEADDACVLIWTTTPWTLPANLAVAVHPRHEYVAVRYAHPGTGRTVVSVLAALLAEPVLRRAGVADYAVLGRAPGEALVGLRYRHPFIARVCPVVAARYVTLEDGTGCVHTAPGHGLEDYQTGLECGLEILSPVDEDGRFTEEAGMFAGRHIEQGDREICEHLTAEGLMLAAMRAAHSYPHCWRCHRPVIFRATRQWFVRMDHDGFRHAVLDAVDRTNWVPKWGRERMRSMIQERPDWCISRQKSWGVPIPALYCRGCDEVLLTRESVLKVAEVFARRGSDSWFEDDDASAFLPQGARRCPRCGSEDWRKESDIFDVWFESGSSHNSVCRKNPDLRFPADLYLEGVDQYRGWFQLSLLPSLAAWGQAPYRTVLTHGFVVDEAGRKMSKSKGNFIGVEEAVGTFRADILRLWTLSVDYRDQISVNADYIKSNMADAYRRIRNTFRFLLGNVSDFDPARHAVPYGRMREIDRWALDETARLVEGVTRAFETYELHRAFSLLHGFCAVQMSSVYLDVLKDRLYCSGADRPERRSAQTALHHVLLALCKLCAPVLVHTAEEVWSHIQHKDEGAESVHLCLWPQPPAEWLDEGLRERWRRLLAVRDEVARAVEALRERKAVANNMEARVVLWAEDAQLRSLLKGGADSLLELLIASELTLLDERPSGEALAAMCAAEKVQGLMLAAEPSPHAKCARCWNLRPSVGVDAGHPDLCGRCAEAVSAAR